MLYQEETSRLKHGVKKKEQRMKSRLILRELESQKKRGEYGVKAVSEEVTAEDFP